MTTNLRFDNNNRLVFDINCVKHPVIAKMQAEEAKVIVGYQRELLLLNLLFPANGHALLMANSGLGKTKIASCLPLIIDGFKSARVQGTPDLLPSTVIGYSIITANGEVKRFDGQVPGGANGANLLLVDEATRLGARLWAAFLQMLEEREKTVEDITQSMNSPFVGILTANFPSPGQGTVELPDAAYDRLMFNIQWGYPSLSELDAIIERAQWLRKAGSEKNVLRPVTDIAEIRQMATNTETLAGTVSPNVRDYIGRLTYATNPHLELMTGLTCPREGKSFVELVAMGGSPRCAMDLKMAACAFALACGDDVVRPEHVKAVFPEVARAHTKMNDAANLGRKRVRVDHLIDAILVYTRP